MSDQFAQFKEEYQGIAKPRLDRHLRLCREHANQADWKSIIVWGSYLDLFLGRFTWYHQTQGTPRGKILNRWLVTCRRIQDHCSMRQEDLQRFEEDLQNAWTWAKVRKNTMCKKNAAEWALYIKKMGNTNAGWIKETEFGYRHHINFNPVKSRSEEVSE